MPAITDGKGRHEVQCSTQCCFLACPACVLVVLCHLMTQHYLLLLVRRTGAAAVIWDWTDRRWQSWQAHGHWLSFFRFIFVQRHLYSRLWPPGRESQHKSLQEIDPVPNRTHWIEQDSLWPSQLWFFIPLTLLDCPKAQPRARLLLFENHLFLRKPRESLSHWWLWCSTVGQQ